MQGYYPSQFYGYVDNEGNIFVLDGMGDKRIGVSVKKYNQLEKMANDLMAKAENYQQQLIEHGIIQKELTPDEKITALSGQVEQLTALVAQLVADKQPQTQHKPEKGKKSIQPEVLPPMNGGEQC